MGIREDMPVLARHEGVWDGVYVYYNAAGVKIDEHQSRLLAESPSEANSLTQEVPQYAFSSNLRPRDDKVKAGTWKVQRQS